MAANNIKYPDLGAMVARATTQQMAALDRYGRALGLAFQVTDDLLDVCGEEGVKTSRDLLARNR